MDKRWLQICGAAVLSFALAGCGGSGGGQQAVSPAGPQEAAWVQEAPASEEQAGPAAETPTSGAQTEAETGAASSGEIGSEAAFAIALENAGVPEGDAYNVKVEPDRENDISIWQVEFETDYGDYDFEIAVDGGRIIGADYEVDEEWLDFLGGSPVAEDGRKAMTGVSATRASCITMASSMSSSWTGRPESSLTGTQICGNEGAAIYSPVNTFTNKTVSTSRITGRTTRVPFLTTIPAPR